MESLAELGLGGDRGGDGGGERGSDLRSSVSEIVGGWAFWTFDIDDRWIARFPRNEAIAAAAERELRLLPALSRHLSFPVPDPSHVGRRAGWPFFVYSKIRGRGLTSADGSPSVLDRLGSMLAEMHAFPVARAAELLEIARPEQAWRAQYEALWPDVEAFAIPAMRPEIARRVEREFQQFMDGPFNAAVTLVHNDLGLEHLLVDHGTAEPTGIIDFESAWIGDPAIDFVPLVSAFGAGALERLLAGRDLGEGLADRLYFYRWMGSVHAIIYGVTEEIDRERNAGLAELTRRLDRAERSG